MSAPHPALIARWICRLLGHRRVRLTPTHPTHCTRCGHCPCVRIEPSLELSPALQRVIRDFQDDRKGH